MADYTQPDYVEKRLRYFDGQLLKDQDFVDEQKYFIDRQRRYNRFLNVAGIIHGLTLTTASDLVTVAPGAALDNRGRLVVLSDQVIETERQAPLRDYRGQTADLVILYKEDPDPPTGNAPRFREKPQLTVVRSGQPTPADAIALARLTIDNAGVVTVNTSVRIYAGLRLPYDGAAPGAGPALRAGSTNRMDLTGGLSVSGNVGIGTTTPNDKLHVVGGDMRVDNGTLWLRAGSDVNHGIGWYGANKPFASTNIDGPAVFGYVGGALGTTEGGQKLALSWKSSGNVGIGTTGPNAKLQVDNPNAAASQALILSNSNPGFAADEGVYQSYYVGATTGNEMARIQAANKTANVGSHGYLAFYTRNADQLTEKVRIDNTGNLGLGIAVPDKRLQVEAGEFRVRASHNNTTADIGVFYAQNLSQGIGIGYNRIEAIGSNADQHILIMPKGAGNVGIGTTDPGSYKLKVDGTLNVTGASTLTGNTSVGGTLSVTGASTLTGNTSVGGTLSVTGASTLTGNTSISGTLSVTGASTLTGNTSVGGTLSVTGASTFTGNVGIGTTSPDNKLTITGAQQSTEANITGNVANNALNIEANYTADNHLPGVVWTTNDNNATKPKAGIWVSEHGTGSRLYLGTSNNYATGITNKAITIYESGNVGIGTTTPNDKLHVVGGNMRVDNGTLWLRAGSDVNHGIGWYGEGKIFANTAVDGPVVFGYAGGALGTTSGGQKLALSWNSSGNVGIGTTTTDDKLDVAGSLRILRGSNPIRFTSAWNAFPDGTGVTNQAEISNDTGNYKTLMIVGNKSNDNSTRRVSVWDRLEVNGDVYITGTLRFPAANNQYWSIYPERSDPNDQDLFFDFSGNTSNWVSGWLEPMGGGWKNNSDERLKKDIEPISNVLDRVVKLQPKSYRWRQATEDSRKAFGFIAQDVEKVWPEFVSEKKGYKGLNYSDFGVLAIAAIKEQHKLLLDLKEEIDNLKKTVQQK
jgi:hypothetical protein